MSLYKAVNKGYFDVLEGVISTGKEANVYKARKNEKIFAVKIFRTDTSEFKSMWKYIKGDKRFDNVKMKRRDIVYAFSRKEFKNLSIAVEAGVRAPEPIFVVNNVLVMEFIGENGNPCQYAKVAKPRNPEKWYGIIIDYIKRMYKKDLIHGDISEYNILNQRDKPVLIDFSQGVPRDHYLANELLLRDINRVNSWFRKLGVKVRSEKEIYEDVTSE
ncbi:MAG: serine protein kinase RIO [Candidatus Parvarchaeota archaeon]|nr:serine protein kinase RIO [Candidatus Jingweiarchaeum tengchongense]MCW1304460.1 serine protein kinase RIO [Candidatus Jingweiarchaeum tengchongense]MCW1305627.1 serine protein kinase RIO [Candidatus Jingweiarchaeum tengchongense]